LGSLRQRLTAVNTQIVQLEDASRSLEMDIEANTQRTLLTAARIKEVGFFVFDWIFFFV